jgi:hypothetical protein
LFEVEDFGPQALAGFAAPQQFQLLVATNQRVAPERGASNRLTTPLLPITRQARCGS